MKKFLVIFIAFWLLLGLSSLVSLTLKKRSLVTSLENGKLAKQWYIAVSKGEINLAIELAKKWCRMIKYRER